MQKYNIVTIFMGYFSCIKKENIYLSTWFVFCYNTYMRLDKFLKVSRLIKRRTVANKVSEQGRIYVNGVIAKPAKQLKEGDIITIVQADTEIKVKIVRVPNNNVSVQEAPTLYEVIN